MDMEKKWSWFDKLLMGIFFAEAKNIDTAQSYLDENNVVRTEQAPPAEDLFGNDRQTTAVGCHCYRHGGPRQ